MRYDIVLVTYNSEKWLLPCVNALSQVQYPLSELHIIFADNASCDDTISVLHKLKMQYPAFGAFDIIENAKNLGFGAACNIGADIGNADNIFFLNTDTSVNSEIFTELDLAMSSHLDAAAFECRQTPYETGHHIDPVTLETTWASGAALVVKREFFVKAGGFDKHLFMYCEDVDLSWRLRALGKSIIYVPRAKLIHYAYETAKNGMKLGEYCGSFYGNLLLRYKFGSFKDIINGHKMYLGAIKQPLHFDNVRKALAKNYIKSFVSMWHFLFWRYSHRAEFNMHTSHFDGGFDADRGLARLNDFTNKPLVSVIARTAHRPQLLRLALTTLLHQTYDNFEVIVCEDGDDKLSDMLNDEFSKLNILYCSHKPAIGRAANGNSGLQLAQGEYCMFLDDDDLLYPDHIELFMSIAQQHPCADLILGSAMAMFVDECNNSPYPYKVRELKSMVFDRIDIYNMCADCRIPIEAACFKRTLYEKYGGLCEKLDANEDWAMWLKYLAHAKTISVAGPDIKRMTSLFVQNANEEFAEKRKKDYAKENDKFYSDTSIRFDLSLKDMRTYQKAVLGDIEHLFYTGQLEEYLKATKSKYN
ncbi:MAG: glycosyltransferase family 2 protein [Oscillospiraceae bacterium]